MSHSKDSILSDYCSFDHVYRKVLCPHFESLDDNRDFSQSYALSDCLKAGFSIFSLKAPSMYQFRKMAQVEEQNLSTVYRMGPIPSDNGLRKVLDGVESSDLRLAFEKLTAHFMNDKELRARYQVWQGYSVVSLDGVEHFCSKTVSCQHCLSRKHRDGSQSNYHCMLSAVLVHPDHSEVFPLDHEPIINTDGQVKNDCERNAAKRLFDHLEVAHTEMKTIFVMDALYACAPIIRRLESVNHWKYVIGAKEAGNAHLFAQFDRLDEKGKIKWIDLKDDRGQKWEVAYRNGLELNASSKEVVVNMLYAKGKDAKGRQLVFSYVTNMKLTKSNVARILSIGRSRWKVENETFNTLKNQGYNFKHNYGHGEKQLCTNMAYLMMMAFWVDQLQQAANKTFTAILTELKTRVKLWDSLRAVFKLIEVDSMKQLHEKIADMYCVRLI